MLHKNKGRTLIQYNGSSCLMHRMIILKISNASMSSAETIKTPFLCFAVLFRFLRPMNTAERIITKVSSETNVRCCQDIYPSAVREYPPKPKNSLIFISLAWILLLYSSSSPLSFSTYQITLYSIIFDIQYHSVNLNQIFLYSKT